MQSQAHIKRIVYAKIINCGYHHGSRPDYDMIIRWHRMSKSWCLLNRVINVFLFLLIGTLDTNTLLDDVNLFGTSNIHSTCSVRNYTSSCYSPLKCKSAETLFLNFNQRESDWLDQCLVVTLSALQNSTRKQTPSGTENNGTFRD